MESKEIVEGNIAIAKIMGHEIIYVDGVTPCVKGYNDFCSPVSEFFKYHECWNELVKVYNRILKIYEQKEIVRSELAKNKNFIVQFGTKNFFHVFNNQMSISGTWVKAVNFAKWYLKLIGQ